MEIPMSKRTKILIAAALLTVGAVAAISAPGRRGGHQGGDDMGLGIGDDRGGSRMGFFRRGPLTAEEQDARIRERFARLDKNSDGILDTAEIEAGLAARTESWREGMRERMGGRGMEPGAELMRRFDENKDGKVTKDEFLGGIKRRFAEMDLNNDGRISDDDLPPMMRGRGAIARLAAGGDRQGPGRPGEGRAMNLGWLRGAEVKDGAITLDAAVAKATAEFDRLDANKDGAIDKADFDLMRKEMADYRLKRFLHAFGADKDGKVTRDQFAKVAKERMARMDSEHGDRMGNRERWGGRRGGDGRAERDGDDRRPMRGPDDRAPPAPKQ
jgi:Ca2+-binding EF-hand superfamily protein